VTLTFSFYNFFTLFLVFAGNEYILDTLLNLLRVCDSVSDRLDAMLPAFCILS